MKSKYIVLAFAVPLIFVSCENPADKTTSATVKEAVASEQAPAVAAADGVKYVFTSASEIHFTGSKVTGSHSGGFKTFTGHFTVKDGAPVGTDHKVSIDLNSIWSDSDKLTEHLKSEDFLAVEKFPESSFAVTEVAKTETAFTVSGNFTLHGVTKNISFPATVTEGADAIKIDAKFDINRKDFGIVYAGKTDDLIRDEVVIELKLEAKPEA